MPSIARASAPRATAGIRPLSIVATPSSPTRQQIAEWIHDYGEDSDFVRVRVRGLPPNASDLQYTQTALCSAAQARPVVTLADEPLVCGLDVARGGGDDCTFRFRRGRMPARFRPSASPASRRATRCAW